MSVSRSAGVPARVTVTVPATVTVPSQLKSKCPGPARALPQAGPDRDGLT